VRFCRHGSGVRGREVAVAEAGGRGGLKVRFRGMTPASESAGIALSKAPRALPSRGCGALGAPSAGLSLGGLLASRARLRFTRRGQCTANKSGGQLRVKASRS
jgi:hypothetical protein